ncbi:MAG: nucleotidyltransferase domain-containing protein [Candidatus Thorarchaeota archaeon]|jgi:predicted nucleotidyltransferase
MMSTHQETIADEVIKELKRDRSVVGILICGSLARNEIRPDSDIDFDVITDDDKEHVFVEEFRGGIKVDISIMPLKLLLESVETHPFLLYSALWEKIAYDPKGILKQIRDRLEVYYDAHPEIVEFWKEKLDSMKEAKMRGEQPEGYRLVLDEAEMRFSDGKKGPRIFFRR